jgi:hypothetical protein
MSAAAGTQLPAQATRYQDRIAAERSALFPANAEFFPANAEFFPCSVECASGSNLLRRHAELVVKIGFEGTLETSETRNSVMFHARSQHFAVVQTVNPDNPVKIAPVRFVSPWKLL